MQKKSADDLIAEYHINVNDLYETYMHNSASYTRKKFNLSSDKQIYRILEDKGFDISERKNKNSSDLNLIDSYNIDLDKLYECFLHNGTEYVARTFHITSDLVKRLLKYNNYDLTKRDPTFLLNNKNGYSVAELIDKYNIDVQALYDTYMTNGKLYTAKKFGLSNFKLVERILKFYNFDISKRDSKNINKIKTTNSLKEKYGVEHALQIPDSKNKFKRTNQEKFGFEYFMGTTAFKQKSIATNLEKYGYEWSTQCPEVKQHHDKANYLKYGVKEFKQRNASDKLKLYLNNFELSKKLLQDNQFTFLDLKKYFPEDKDSQLYSWLVRFDLMSLLKHSSRSIPENELYEYLKPFGFTITNDRKLLGNGKEIDIYNPDLKIGIEFNGTYYHCSKVLQDKNYHFNKSKLAQEKMIRLIHIYEYEWTNPEMKEKLKSLLTIACNKVNTKIYARKCDVKEISNKEAREFNNKNHLQGHRNAQITYGLFYEGKLVQLMSFSRTKYNRNLKGDNDWEIIRGCPGSNNIVIGGVSKLFKHFIQDNNPDRIFSYCDFNKFDGRGYEAIGMKFIGYTGPDKKWIIHGKVVNRNPYHYHELKDQAEAVIWGAGSKKYLWEKELNTTNDCIL